MGGGATAERPLGGEAAGSGVGAGLAAGGDPAGLDGPDDPASLYRPDDSAGLDGPDDRTGLYGPDSEAWVLNREAALLLGAGPLAVLLQIAHPLIAEGVAQHSTFRTDPWARLEGTLRSYLRIVYGSGPAARAEIRRLNGLHRSVTGPVTDPVAASRFGRAYAARDPELSLWVHATLVWATLRTVERWLGPVPPGRRARFYAETRVVGRGFGVPEPLLPTDVEAFDAYVAAMLAPDGPVRPSAVSRDLAWAILHPPLAPVVERGGVARALGPLAPAAARVLRATPRGVLTPLLIPAVGLLTDPLRAELGLPWGAAERVLDRWLTAAWRAWRPVFPPAVRWFPQALDAYERVGRREG